MMKKQKNTIQIKTIAIILIIIVISFLITSYSSVINPFSDDDPYDSWIFRYMGMLILKGGLPYRDAFEQKGPLLFIYETDRLCSSIYFIQEPIYELNSLLKEDIKNDINENYPSE